MSQFKECEYGLDCPHGVTCTRKKSNFISNNFNIQYRFNIKDYLSLLHNSNINKPKIKYNNNNNNNNNVNTVCSRVSGVHGSKNSQ
jgi:hypothetical protein